VLIADSGAWSPGQDHRRSDWPRCRSHARFGFSAVRFRYHHLSRRPPACRASGV